MSHAAAQFEVLKQAVQDAHAVATGGEAGAAKHAEDHGDLHDAKSPNSIIYRDTREFKHITPQVLDAALQASSGSEYMDIMKECMSKAAIDELRSALHVVRWASSTGYVQYGLDSTKVSIQVFFTRLPAMVTAPACRLCMACEAVSDKSKWVVCDDCRLVWCTECVKSHKQMQGGIGCQTYQKLNDERLLHTKFDPKTCTVCSASTPPPRKCAACNAVAYCGVPCQSADWALLHKRECGHLRSLAAHNAAQKTSA